ncbi:cellulose biosynthesis protein BcsP [Xylophilus sp. GOD-11R]|uniref:cellulose biosynthesis protein BcsP n=1 Tax=Xylophilus sp. GOD-11R TaxID=3089814 RepID=UPI00298D2CD5|nr:cellulose biosynthesis protein BcsP [Xylophilus sp. GOD-11R]WPB56951.1 cellulose biosynthesis protein BcsP [Xylophilus sp. GOD-11R]
MSSDDIANLYRQFGGESDGYQELGRDNVVRQSRERWPLLANVRKQDAARVVRPGPVAGGLPAAPVSDGPVAPVFDEAAAAAAAEEARHRPPVARPRAPMVPPRPTASEVPVEPVVMAAAAPVEPILSPEPLPARAATPKAPQPLVPPAPPRAAPTPVPAAGGNELAGVFARLARAPEPPAAPADRNASILRRLLRS